MICTCIRSLPMHKKDIIKVKQCLEIFERMTPSSGGYDNVLYN